MVTVTVFSISQLYASEVYQQKDSMECYFTYSKGSSAIHSNLGNNAYELQRLDDFIRSAIDSRSIYVKRIRLTGYCSIEGSYAQNEQLARARAEAFRDYVHQHYPALYRYPVDYTWVPEDWNKLETLVSLSNLTDKNEILRIIRNVGIFNGRESQLMNLKGGDPYRKMAKELFPLLRRVEITVEYDVAKMSGRLGNPTPEPVIEEIVEVVAESKKVNPEKVVEVVEVVEVDRLTPDETAITFTSPSTNQGQAQIIWGEFTEPALQARRREPERIEQHRLTLYNYSCRNNYPLLAIKTNLLSWAGITHEGKRTAFTPNLAVEYFLSPSWSVEAGGSYAYWHYNGGRRFWGISGYRLEPRYWFSLPNLRHIAYLGLYGRVGDYDMRDFEDEQAVETTNRTARYWDVGLSGGLYLQLTPWLGLEFGVRVGYVHSKTAIYTIHPPHAYLDRYEPYHKLQITNLLLNIVYRIGR